MKHIPVLCHPTTVTLIDDDSSLLNNLTLSLSTHFKCKTFTSATDGKNAITKDYKKLFRNKYMDVSYEGSNLSLGLKTSEIHKEIYNDQRFSPSTIAIIDYEMPEINGLMLAKELRKEAPNVKIIMFTGEADHETAITAFNNNEIDRFVQKNTCNYDDTLVSYINELKQDFFLQSFANILESVAHQQGHPLKDPEYITIFDQITKENNIIEYYLLDDSGSFLMLDNMGTPTWLIVRTEEDMQTYYELAEGDGAPNDMLESLRKREKIVLFSNNDFVVPHFEQWQLQSAKKIKNKKIYYCVLKESEPFLDLKKISNYKQFLLSQSL